MAEGNLYDLKHLQQCVYLLSDNVYKKLHTKPVHYSIVYTTFIEI